MERTPTGRQLFVVCATDQAGTKVCRPTIINVNPAPTLTQDPLVFNAGVLPHVIVGIPYPGYSFCNPEPAPGLFCGGPLPANLATSNPAGGTPHYTFSHGIGIPFGLTLNFNGLLTGTPKKRTPTGPQRFNVCATDQAGTKVCWQAVINVIDFSGTWVGRWDDSLTCEGSITINLTQVGTRMTGKATLVVDINRKECQAIGSGDRTYEFETPIYRWAMVTSDPVSF